MLEQVELAPKSLGDYRTIVGDEVVDEILVFAQPLNGMRVVHVNATAFGGGVAEILMTLVPLMRDAGLEAEWQVIAGADEFFNVTKACHNGLQGMDIPFTQEMQDTWQRHNLQNAADFEGEYDYVIVHDPQPAGLLHFHSPGAGRCWIWRCHIDTSQPNPSYWDFFEPYLKEYDDVIFSRREYAGPAWSDGQLWVIPPSIDPLSPKNELLPLSDAHRIVESFGIDLNRPLITQVSRFDSWKDPLGVIDAYRLVKEKRPDVQLALVGSMASDDPEGWYYLDKTSRHAGEDPDIYILHNFHGVGPVEVGAFQSVSDIIVQKSIREGFGLVVTEALWKGNPVVGGNAGGIPLQVVDGETGFLVDGIESCAQRISDLLSNPELREEMGGKARAYVREHFLSTRHLRDYLRLFNHLR